MVGIYSFYLESKSSLKNFKLKMLAGGEKDDKKIWTLFSKFLVFSFGIICIYYICSFICVRYTTYALEKAVTAMNMIDEVTDSLSLDYEKVAVPALDLEIGRCKIAYSIPKDMISSDQIETKLQEAGYEVKKYTKGDNLYLSTEKNGWSYTIDDSWQYTKSGEKTWTIVAEENTLFNRCVPFIDLYRTVPIYNVAIYIIALLIGGTILIYTYIRSLVPRK